MCRIELAPARAAHEGAPLFTCPSVWGVSPEKPILFRIPLLGERPMRVTAHQLPEGVLLDEERGILTGSAKRGEYAVRLRAENGWARRKRRWCCALSRTARAERRCWASPAGTPMPTM